MQPSSPLEGAEIRNILGLPGGSRQDGVDGAREAAVFGRFVPLSAGHPAHETERCRMPVSPDESDGVWSARPHRCLLREE